jgi:hypothetical protein
VGVIKAIHFLIRGFFVCHFSLAAENLALRQQLAILEHSVKRPKLRPRDRVFWALTAGSVAESASVYALTDRTGIEHPPQRHEGCQMLLGRTA